MSQIFYDKVYWKRELFINSLLYDKVQFVG